MSHQYEGRVTMANGRPLAEVQIRLFDRDFAGSDDDLTLEPGLSDRDGQFIVRYQPERTLNFSDIFLPYLRFEFELNGRTTWHQSYLQPFSNEHRLPVRPASRFVPSEHGFQFVNSFRGFWIPYSVNAMPDIPVADHYYGLCGGMVAAALDFRLAARPIPLRRKRPGRASTLHQYLHQRQVDSLGTLGKQVVRFARWMALPDEAVERRTWNEFTRLREFLDQGQPTPIGLVYVGTNDTLQIWHNHQVLACGYEESDSGVTIQIYDPNFPQRDNGAILCRRNGANRLQSEQRLNRVRSRPVRGFFIMPYSPIEPPASLTVDS